MDVEQVTLLLAMSNLVRDSTGSLTEKLYKDIKPTMFLDEVRHIMDEHIQKDPTCSRYVLSTRPQSPSPERRARRQTPGRRNTNRNYTHSRTRSQHRTQQQLTCYNCQKPGHTVRDCYTAPKCENCQFHGHCESQCWGQPYCTYHQMIGHQNKECRQGAFVRGRYNRGNFRRAPPTRRGGGGSQSQPDTVTLTGAGQT